jgi:hypothetical protein
MASLDLEHLLVLDVLLFFKFFIFLSDTAVGVFPVDFLLLFTLGSLNASLEGSHTLAELGMHLVNVGLDVVGAESAEPYEHI